MLVWSCVQTDKASAVTFFIYCNILSAHAMEDASCLTKFRLCTIPLPLPFVLVSRSMFSLAQLFKMVQSSTWRAQLDHSVTVPPRKFSLVVETLTLFFTVCMHGIRICRKSRVFLSRSVIPNFFSLWPPS